MIPRSISRADLKSLIQSTYFLPGTLLGISVIGLGLSTYVTNAYTKLVPTSIILFSLLFLLVSRKYKETTLEFNERYLFILFFIILGISTIQFSLNPYRPVSSIILTGTLFVLVGLMIFYAKNPVKHLILILCVGLVHRFQLYYSSSMIFGMDELDHNRAANEVATSGTIAPIGDILGRYYYTSIYHSYTSISSQIFASNIRTAAALTLISATVIPILVIFTIGRESHSNKIGLLGSWLFAVSGYGTYWAVRPQPTTLGIAFAAIILVSIILHFERDSMRQIYILIGFFAALLLTHQISPFTIFVGIVSISVIYNLFSYKHKILNLILLMSSMTGGTWLAIKYSGPGSEGSFLPVVLARAVLSVLETSGRPSVQFPESDAFVLSGADAATVLDVLPIALFIGTCIFGALYSIRFESDSTQKIILGLSVGGGIMTGLAFAGPVVGLRNLIPSRWFVFIYLLIIPVSSYGLYTILWNIENVVTRWISRSHIGVILVLICLVPVVILMVGTAPSAIDGQTVDESSSAVRLTVTEPEKEMYEWTVRHVSEDNGVVVGDHISSQIMGRHYAIENTERFVYDNHLNRTIYDGSDEYQLRRGETTTNQASYWIEYNDVRLRVIGPVPYENGSTVYSSGSDYVSIVDNNS